MSKKEREQLYQEAKELFGYKLQLVVLMEELAELQKEIAKILRGELDHSDLIAELADVEIMIEQLKLLYNIKDTDVKQYKDIKLNRLGDMIREKRKANGQGQEQIQLL